MVVKVVSVSIPHKIALVSGVDGPNALNNPMDHARGGILSGSGNPINLEEKNVNIITAMQILKIVIRDNVWQQLLALIMGEMDPIQKKKE